MAAIAEVTAGQSLKRKFSPTEGDKKTIADFLDSVEMKGIISRMQLKECMRALDAGRSCMGVGFQPSLQSYHAAPLAEPAQKKQRTAAAGTTLDASTAAGAQADAVAVELEVVSPLRPRTTEAADRAFDEAAAEAAKEAAHDDDGAALLADGEDASWLLEQAEAMLSGAPPASTRMQQPAAVQSNSFAAIARASAHVQQHVSALHVHVADASAARAQIGPAVQHQQQQQQHEQQQQQQQGSRSQRVRVASKRLDGFDVPQRLR